METMIALLFLIIASPIGIFGYKAYTENVI